MSLSRIPQDERKRLPTLFEVLNRKSLAPVDLWSFYVYTRDQHRGVDYLDFWLDVVQHLSLCRHYIRGLRQSILASEHTNLSLSNITGQGNLTEQSRESSILLETLIHDHHLLEDGDSHRLSEYLRGENLLSDHDSSAASRLSALLGAMHVRESQISEDHAPSNRSERFMLSLDEKRASHLSNASSNLFQSATPPINEEDFLPQEEHGMIRPGSRTSMTHSLQGSARQQSLNRKSSRASLAAQAQPSLQQLYDEEQTHLSMSNISQTGPTLQSQLQFPSPDHSGEQPSTPQSAVPQQPTLAQRRNSQLSQILPQSPNANSPLLDTQPASPLQTQLNALPHSLPQPRNPLPADSRNSSQPLTLEIIEKLFPKRNEHGVMSDVNSPNFITRERIRESSQQILVTYFMPGAERELAVPAPLMESVRTAIEQQGRDDPEVFDECREYVFQILEREVFPGFLATKALGNLVPLGALVRMVAGLVAVFGAVWTGFCLIFLNYSRTQRVWVLLPFAIGWYLVIAGLFSLDPIQALLGFSESSLTKRVRIKEPFVRRLLLIRSSWVMLWVVVVTACFTVIFACVPGHRL
ncbi:Protein rax1 [Yarrowia sp. C11]|nr:Protein rax1 [Yarrowia sp. E02]KAG5371781.1 Protein rax1 [Yarrowia sp. C11]